MRGSICSILKKNAREVCSILDGLPFMQKIEGFVILKYSQEEIPIWKEYSMIYAVFTGIDADRSIYR
jgi:hypothetical protein